MTISQPVLPVVGGQQRRTCEECRGQMRLASSRPHPALARLDVRIFECMDCSRIRQFLVCARDEVAEN
jgi:hypothetical protein